MRGGIGTTIRAGNDNCGALDGDDGDDLGRDLSLEAEACLSDGDHTGLYLCVSVRACVCVGTNMQVFRCVLWDRVRAPANPRRHARMGGR